jgi:hypothetical protein
MSLIHKNMRGSIQVEEDGEDVFFLLPKEEGHYQKMFILSPVEIVRLEKLRQTSSYGELSGAAVECTLEFTPKAAPYDGVVVNGSSVIVEPEESEPIPMGD